MSKVLVLYYSSYGHLETMAQAVAEGARASGATVDVKRVPETVPEDVAKSAYFKLNQAAPVATVAELVKELSAREERYEVAFSDLDALRVAVDQDLTDFDASLTNAREVAFFPPMTGG